MITDNKQPDANLTDDAKTPPLPLPGDLSQEEDIKRMLRVDHAGETGAVRIYQGQLAVMGKDHPNYDLVKHMLEQEERHLATFNEILPDKGVRPSLLDPLWNVAGFALGTATALMGDKAAMACTEAVEEVIDEHYQEQRNKLQHWKKEPELEKTIAQFQAEELEHKDLAVENGAHETPGYKALHGVIKSGCRAAIWLAKRV